MKKKSIYIAGGLLALAGLTALLVFQIGQSDDSDGKRPAYQRPFSDKEIRDAFLKLNLAPATPAAAVPVLLDPKQQVRLAVGCLGMTNDAENRQMATWSRLN